MLSNNNPCIKRLKNNDFKKYHIILDIMNTLFNGYNWYYVYSIDVAFISALIGLTLRYKKDQIHTNVIKLISCYKQR